MAEAMAIREAVIFRLRTGIFLVEIEGDLWSTDTLFEVTCRVRHVADTRVEECRLFYYYFLISTCGQHVKPNMLGVF